MLSDIRLSTPAMLELIERLEKATGPDRELDAEIAATIKVYTGQHEWVKNWPGKWKAIQGLVYLLGEHVPHGNFEPLPFTSSIDAALTLARDVEERKLMIIAMVNAFKNVDALDTFAWLKEAIIFALRARLSLQNVDEKDMG